MTVAWGVPLGYTCHLCPCYTCLNMSIFRQAKGFVTPQQLPSACQGQLHPMAEEGLRLFAQGEYWHAHEALEQAWLEEPGPVRHLYKGILQAGVLYLHVQRQNFLGVVKMYERSKVWLAPWPDHCHTIDVGQLRADIQAVIKVAGRLGPDRLDQFDPSLLKPVKRVPAA